MTAARSEVVSAVSSLTTVKSAYDAAQASATTAQNSASGGTTNSIAAAQASVEEATGALDSAKAALAKTIIRSPISGTIINLPVTSGDYVSAFSEVAQVSNPGALKVVVEVTPDDAQTLAVGNSTFVNGTVTGVITEIAPAIDPQTGAIEVDVGLSGDITGLIDGDSVTVDLDRTISQVTATHSSSPIVPIVALKITPEGPVVFTVNPTTHALVAHAVSIGAILGANIEVTQGLTSNMVIVTDARGLTVGELVSVAQSHS
jgi:RND family efflux transporter MFP subunit